jgi:DNA-binding transcriptional MerR regulator
MAGRRVPIGTVADRYGVPATTLRYWEDIGLLPQQKRSGGQRRYDRDALRRVMFIRMAKQSGLSQRDSCAPGRQRSQQPDL